ncbi:sialate O-acetylesterase [Mucilaginibacter yixingensis]|uniref:Sialate O-acetylesterase n=1 Tax=Mucilaginibacter yixingensis TaxID=1295612 RepID=A0A2T5J9A1_9SPHI|nr:sialate O-acetylesterase [Mucilaginibacter yixingensis]PTQ96648.1 sialate O-acetylesterase [Mucilaginibacter yixingensis]
MKKHWNAAGVLAYLVLCCLSSKADVRLPQLIGDGMVLQRDVKLKVWGWASPAEHVSVKINGKTANCIAAQDGKWLATLPAMKAGGPYTMTVDGKNHIILKDILIGDVWFCSGQSNMVLPVERVKERYPEEVASANYPQIRNFFIPTASDVRGQHADLPPGKWRPTNPKTVLEFGAASYFFAKQLYLKYHVPIGIINSSVGGTPIQAWIGADGFKSLSGYQKRLDQFKDSSFMNRVTRARRQADASHTQATDPDPDKGLSGGVKWYAPGFIPQNWHKFWLPGYWADQGVRGLNGVVWFRKEVNIPESMVGQAAKLFMGRIVDADETYVNGQKVGNTTYQYPPRRYDIPAGLLKAGKNVIVIRLTNTIGKGGFVPDKRYELTDGKTSIDLRGDWLYQVGQVLSPFRAMENIDRDAVFSAQNEPTGLYNTMVAPAINYAVKGMVWYQGESNPGTPDYHELLTTLITSWRADWRQGNVPFLIVQLPNFGDAQYSPSESQWAQIREAELQSLALPNTGLAVTIDAGEWNDVHPVNKEDVGDRLALAAEKIAYGDTKVVASGPIFQSAQVQDHQIVLSFNSVGGGLIAKGGEPLTQFAIAGEDKKFVWADARIDGDKVIVSSARIDHPLYARYAWADNPDGANLYNQEGLPASPFRTDKP